MRLAAIPLLLAAAGCSTNFEDRSIVIDLRVLAAAADPPEVVIPLPDNVSTIEQALAEIELPDIRLCGLAADPGQSRPLDWLMTVCPVTSSRRCDDAGPAALRFAAGTVDDPDESPTPVAMCGTLRESPILFGLLQIAIEDDPLAGFSSLPLQIELRVVPAGAGVDQAVYAAKRVYFALQLPAERVANRNPALAEIRASRSDPTVPDEQVTPRRCADVDAAPIALASGEQLTLLPVEAPGSREDYVLPTFDGGSRRFTENLRYSWYATDGTWSAATSGGSQDSFGNQPKLDSRWTAPRDIAQPTDIDLWLVQRDERGGLAWYEMCARVEPAP
jgi:hypothetical protein